MLEFGAPRCPLRPPRGAPRRVGQHPPDELQRLGGGEPGVGAPADRPRGGGGARLHGRGQLQLDLPLRDDPRAQDRLAPAGDEGVRL